MQNKWTHRILQKWMDAVFPRRCPFCNKIIRQDTCCCKACSMQVQALHRGYVFPVFIPACNRFVHCIIPFSYQKQIRSGLLAFKFMQHKTHALFFSQAIAAMLSQHTDFKEIDLFTVVPPAGKGYFHLDYLAKDLALSTSLAYFPGLLQKIKKTQKQHQLSLAQRKKNLAGAFALASGATVKDKTILLIDDIYTTGSTAKECSDVLFRGGAKAVMVACIARTDLTLAN